MPEPSVFDPLNRMDPGEDRFVIREKDPCGPPTLTEWARLRRNRAFKLFGINPTGDAKRLLDAELVQCKEAEEKALAWSDRQSGGDEVEGQKATYNDVRLSEEQVAAAKRQKMQRELEQHLAEADYLAHELVTLDGAAVSSELAGHAEQIHALAIEVRNGAKARAA